MFQGHVDIANFTVANCCPRNRKRRGVSLKMSFPVICIAIQVPRPVGLVDERGREDSHLPGGLLLLSEGVDGVREQGLRHGCA